MLDRTPWPLQNLTNSVNSDPYKLPHGALQTANVHSFNSSPMIPDEEAVVSGPDFAVGCGLIQY